MIYRFDRFELDVARSLFSSGGEPIELQPKVLDALVMFVESEGRLLAKEEILTRLWAGVFVTEESLTQVVRKLRAALGDDPQSPRFLQTVHKRGYRFLPAVTRVDPVPPAAVAPAAVAPVLAAAAHSPARRRAPALLFGGVLALALLLLVVALRKTPPPGPAIAQSPDGGPVWRDHRLTATTARESFPALAPDGARYAFVRPVESDTASDLFVAALDGGLTRLTASPGEEFAPQFSPDGGSIVYSLREHGRGSVWSVPVLGGAPHLLVDDAEWGTWAPGGDRIAFVRREPGDRSTIRELDLASGATRLLWATEGPLSAAAWSPDGRAIAAIGRSQVLVGRATSSTEGAEEAAGGDEVRVVGPVFEYVRSLAWEPDSAALAVDGRLSGEGGSLTRLPLDGSPPTPLTRGSINLFHPSLSRDGRLLLYAAEHKVRQVWRLDADRRPVEALALPTALECFDVSPDGAALAATDWSPSENGSTLMLFGLDGLVPPRALGSGLCPAFSPRGDRLSFLGYQEAEEGETPETTGRGLWVLDLATGSRRRIAPDRGELGLPETNAARRPAWSPDGGRIAYEGVDLPEGSGIFEVDVATEQRRLLAANVFGNLSWSPDGRFLAASGAGPETGFVVIDVVGRQARRVTDDAGAGAPPQGDGAGGAGGLEGGAYRASAFWRGDGRVVLLTDQTSRPQLVAVDPLTFAVDPPVPVPLPLDASFRGLFELVPDRRGGYLATVERYESDLYLAERGP